uniref:ABC transporter domain-containing protein n=1 Tax=Alexandrium monilatum TaxID=311494 RepID=A0A7S4VM41_9DINO
MLAAADNQSLTVLAKELEDTAPWHRIVSVNGTRGDIKAISGILCTPGSAEVRIFAQSGWLNEGAEVVVEDLRTGYGDIPRDILKDINVIVDPCSKAGIVGTTGCGKSTLLLSLLRILEPRDGRILINGVDTQQIGLQTLRQSVGLVPQDPVLLQTSVRENLDPFWVYNDEEIWKGLSMVQLADTVRNMEFGVWTPLTTDGNTMSYGQRQLLNLCRMVIRQPSLILLDEATSALDPATQELVQKTIESFFPRSTIIVIAHRLETVLGFDQIIVMEQGSIAEKGSPSDLAEVKGGLFAKMLAAKRTW